MGRDADHLGERAEILRFEEDVGPVAAEVVRALGMVSV